MNSRKKYKLTADSTKGPVERTHKHKNKITTQQYNCNYFKTHVLVLRRKFLTVLVARLPERFALGENNGNNEVLEGGDIEEAGVLIVLDVMVIDFCVVEVGYINVGCEVADAG